MARAFVGVGSNTDPAENVSKAIRLLARRARVLAVSTVYEAESEGGREQPPYYNCVVEVETELPALEFKRSVLRQIEQELGRQRSSDRYAPRTIDLDLILYDDLVAATDELTLPDPEIAHRPFLAIPLHELAPSLALPGSGVPIAEVAAALPRERMKPLTRYTELLRKEIADGP